MFYIAVQWTKDKSEWFVGVILNWSRNLKIVPPFLFIESIIGCELSIKSNHEIPKVPHPYIQEPKRHLSLGMHQGWSRHNLLDCIGWNKPDQMLILSLLYSPLCFVHLNLWGLLPCSVSISLHIGVNIKGSLVWLTDTWIGKKLTNLISNLVFLVSLISKDNCT